MLVSTLEPDVIVVLLETSSDPEPESGFVVTSLVETVGSVVCEKTLLFEVLIDWSSLVTDVVVVWLKREGEVYPEPLPFNM